MPARRRIEIPVPFVAVWVTTVPWAPALGADEDPPVRFTEVAADAGLDFVETIGDDEMTNIIESAGVGCGFVDYDGDGWMDVYFVNGHWMRGLSDASLRGAKRAALARSTDRLFRNKGDGTFEDVTARAGLDRPGYGMGVIAADYDADGDTDLYVTNYGPNFLFRNNGDGTFTEAAGAAGVADPRFSVGAAFLDFDRDGWLDLYVGSYVEYDPDYKLFYAPDGFPGPLAYEGQSDRLFRNNGDGTFSNVTTAAGIDIEPKGRAMGVAAFDYNADGWMDVFVSNDAMENFLFHNSGDGTFENRAVLHGVAFGENGEATAAMGVEVVDYDGDGLVDMFVPDMGFQCLYRNIGEGLFEDFSARSGIAAVMGQYIGWSGVFADLDLNGTVDLYISNGDVHHLEAHEDVVFVGDGKGRFTDVSETAGDWMREKRVGRGAARGDFDNDGDVDILVTHLNDRPALLRNDTPRRGRHWLRVRLIGRPPNGDAIGAVVTVRTKNGAMSRHRLSGGTYLSQHDPRLHFGLGTHDQVDVEVRWPDGAKQTLANVAANEQIDIRQPPAPAGSKP